MRTRRRAHAIFGCASCVAIHLCWIALVVVSACVGQISDSGQGEGRGRGPDAGSSSGNADASTTADGPEIACDDQVDNDGDGAFDCDDADCAGEEHCGWPSEMRIDIELAFEASSLAELGGYSDCVTRVEASVADSRAASCATCDRGYTGPYVYVADTCPEAPRPAEGAYGVRFASDTQREIHVLDEAGVWQLVGMATGSGGVFTLTRADPVDYEGNDAGDITTTMAITDL